MKILFSLIVVLLAVIAFLLAYPPAPQTVIMAASTPPPATPPPRDPAAEMDAVMQRMKQDQERAAEAMRSQQEMADAELQLKRALLRVEEMEERAKVAREAVLGPGK